MSSNRHRFPNYSRANVCFAYVVINGEKIYMDDDFLKWTGLVHLEYNGMTVMPSDISRRLLIYHAITSPGGAFKLNATLRNEPSGIVVLNTGTVIKVNQSLLSISSKITHTTAYTTTGFNDILIDILSY
ncbi:hypothetical protein EXVG_00439 [Emiliania huxleyi virus 202]|nr:hypothetical protein EXVG_00439 [Emiliania huxleyi virus 202]AHA54309.1 hypothetical protein EhV18_00263 [Emiliania huxleyi virus 18]AHA55358.1 hypothetical protein EhV156_00263 [Emiliania huxleyi virus 156]